jgi:hypothetical protein
MTHRFVLICVLAILVAPGICFAKTSGCAAVLRDFELETGTWASNVYAIGTFHLNQDNSTLEVKTIWGGKFTSVSYEVKPQDMDKEAQDLLRQDCQYLFSKPQFCSIVHSLELLGSDKEDDAFVLKYLDINGIELGRIAGYPGLIGECQNLE